MQAKIPKEVWCRIQYVFNLRETTAKKSCYSHVKKKHTFWPPLGLRLDGAKNPGLSQLWLARLFFTIVKLVLLTFILLYCLSTKQYHKIRTSKSNLGLVSKEGVKLLVLGSTCLYWVLESRAVNHWVAPPYEVGPPPVAKITQTSLHTHPITTATTQKQTIRVTPTLARSIHYHSLSSE